MDSFSWLLVGGGWDDDNWKILFVFIFLSGRLFLTRWLRCDPPQQCSWDHVALGIRLEILTYKVCVPVLWVISEGFFTYGDLFLQVASPSGRALTSWEQLWPDFSCSHRCQGFRRPVDLSSSGLKERIRYKTTNVKRNCHLSSQSFHRLSVGRGGLAGLRRTH